MLKFEITSEKMRRNGRVKSYYTAKLGKVEAQGWSAKEARENAEEMITRVVGDISAPEIIFIGDRESLELVIRYVLECQ